MIVINRLKNAQNALKVIKWLTVIVRAVKKIYALVKITIIHLSNIQNRAMIIMARK